MKKPPFTFHLDPLLPSGQTIDHDDLTIRTDQRAQDASDPPVISHRQRGLPGHGTPDPRQFSASPDGDAISLTEFGQCALAFSQALAEVTDCLHALEAQESWDPAYRNPEIALRLARKELGRARHQAIDCFDRGAFDHAGAADQALAEVASSLASAIDRRDLCPDRKQVVKAWHDWKATPLRIDNPLARAASDTIHRLFYRMACYCDACLGPQVWPLEMQDPDVDPDKGDLLDQIIML